MSSVPTLSIWQDSLLCGQSLQRGQSVLVPHAPPPENPRQPGMLKDSPAPGPGSVTRAAGAGIIRRWW